MGFVFMQIGAGAGDQDARSNFRDGFTEYVKSVSPQLIERIILVEPNPSNIQALKRCWKDYPQAEFVQAGVTANTASRSAIFYYAQEDAPCYQVFSLNRDHVEKHYPRGTIQSIEVNTYGINELLLDVIRDSSQITLLSLDIEGIDAEVISAVAWDNINFYRLSFEYLHLGQNTEAVLRHLGRCGCICIGLGIDVGGFDLMYENENFHTLDKVKGLPPMSLAFSGPLSGNRAAVGPRQAMWRFAGGLISRVTGCLSFGKSDGVVKR